MGRHPKTNEKHLIEPVLIDTSVWIDSLIGKVKSLAQPTKKPGLTGF